ncbi:MAG: four helix bundle protein [Candidatus Aenigmarchaeota archaeon]|nr:four helix bundle protein [Candidatus Aenigmarchaeota archaeon]
MLCGKTDYKSLEIYSLAHDFVLHVYKLCSSFPEMESNNLTSQLRRAATCLPLNIAEGSGAGSFRIFLNYCIFCYRSCLETEAALRLCKDLSYITEMQHKETLEKLDKFIRKLYNYMRYLEEKAGNRKWDRSAFYRQNSQQVCEDAAKREQMKSLA